jgi:LPS-assembly lipoprotein
MWSPEPVSPRYLLAALGLSVALLAAGCNVQPLYGTTTAPTGGATAVTLADVDVAPIEGRVGQKIRNDLLFYMNGGAPTSGTYIVDLSIREAYTNVITRPVSGLPGGRNIRLITTYTLKKAGEKDHIASGTVVRISSIDYFNQRFANDRATINAEDRAAQETAADIHLRLAAYFATGKSYDKTVPEEEQATDIPTTPDSIFNDREPTYGAPEM